VRRLPFILVPAVWVACATFAGCDMARVLRYGPSEITDFEHFPSRKMTPSEEPYALPPDDVFGLPERMDVPGVGEVEPAVFFQRASATAVVILRDGRILYEWYARGGDPARATQIFSVSKSITSLLVGCALRDGYLAGVRQPVTDIVPELSQGGFDAVTLEHLLDMRSGMNYREWDNPFGRHARWYYGTDLLPSILALRVKEEPGRRFEYRSGDTQLLGLVLQRALAPESITGYAERVLWRPLGAEGPAWWTVDRPDGMEKTFCCLAVRPRDLARVGAMLAAGGAWRGEEIIPAAWLEASVGPLLRGEAEVGDGVGYHYQWWSFSELPGGYMGSGHLGQYLIVVPDARLVVVRFGERGGGKLRSDTLRVTQALREHILSAR